LLAYLFTYTIKRLFVITAIVQMDVLHCQREVNLERAIDYLNKTKADIIVLPEVFTTGFCYDRIGKLAESDPFPTIEKLRKISKEKEIIIIGSIIVSGPGVKFYNLGFVLDKGHLAGTYRKIHPFGTEKEYFQKGDSIKLISTSKGQIGLMICYDVRFPEMARKLALDGADILITIAQFPSRRQDHWDILIRARAIENQIPHLACNRVGSDPYNDFTGGSAVIDAWGNVLANAGDEEGIITAKIDFNETKRVRNMISCFLDRQEELY
jgi:predicted amidohydrolase